MKTITIYHAAPCRPDGNVPYISFDYKGSEYIECNLSTKLAVESSGIYRSIAENSSIMIQMYELEVSIEDIIRPDQYDDEVDHIDWVNGILLVPMKYASEMKDLGIFNLYNIGFNYVLNLYLYRCIKGGLTMKSEDEEYSPIDNIYDFFFLGPVV